MSKEVLAFTANLIVSSCAVKMCAPEADRLRSATTLDQQQQDAYIYMREQTKQVLKHWQYWQRNGSKQNIKAQPKQNKTAVASLIYKIEEQTFSTVYNKKATLVHLTIHHYQARSSTLVCHCPLSPQWPTRNSCMLSVSTDVILEPSQFLGHSI